MDDKGKKEYNTFNKLWPQKNNLSSIVWWLKSTITKQIKGYYINNKLDKTFWWQERFYDRIIRNKDELNKIRQYITDNPKNWEIDKNYSRF